MPEMKEKVESFVRDFTRLRKEVGKVIVGHQNLVEEVLISLFAGGHCLLEGVPGLGKTLLVRTLAQALNLKFSRIQFTPDLMPADILGTQIIMETSSGERVFKFQKGPVFAQIVLADEINRATPKTQSALLEAMQEHTVTVGGEHHTLEEPFMVLATQNPLEMEGTYPLPEAQLDRFFFKINIHYSNLKELREILNRTTDYGAPVVEKVMDQIMIEDGKKLVRQVVAAPHIKDYASKIVLATHPQGEFAIESTNKFIRFGASPRGAQVLMLAGKVRALLAGRYNVAFEDIDRSVCPALRHRLILNFEAEAEGVQPDAILQEVVAKTPKEAEVAA